MNRKSSLECFSSRVVQQHDLVVTRPYPHPKDKLIGKFTNSFAHSFNLSDMKNLPGLNVNSRSIINLKYCITQYSHLIAKIPNTIHLMLKVIINKRLGELALIQIYNDKNLGISLRYIRRSGPRGLLSLRWSGPFSPDRVELA